MALPSLLNQEGRDPTFDFGPDATIVQNRVSIAI